MIHISTISPTKRQKRFHLCTSQRFSKMKHFKQKNKAESVPFFLLITNQDAIFAHSPPLKTAQSHNCSILIKIQQFRDKKSGTNHTISCLCSSPSKPQQISTGKISQNENKNQRVRRRRYRVEVGKVRWVSIVAFPAPFAGDSAVSGGEDIGRRISAKLSWRSPRWRVVGGDRRLNSNHGRRLNRHYVYRRRGGWCGPFLPFFLFFLFLPTFPTEVCLFF